MHHIARSRNIAITNSLRRLNARCHFHTSTSLHTSNQHSTISTYKQPDEVSGKIMTIPNIITMSRIAATPLIGHFIMSNKLTPALGVFAYCCVTDFLDGYIARKYNMNSAAGTILDPIADKLLMLVTTVSMTIPGGPQIIPIPIAAIILSRDFGLAVAGFVLRFTTLRRKYNKVTWNSYWNFFKYPSVVVKPSQISKWNTFLQMIYLGVGVVVLITGSNTKEIENNEEEAEQNQIQSSSLNEKNQDYLLTSFKWLGFIVVGTTILSGTSYTFSKNAVKFIGK